MTPRGQSTSIAATIGFLLGMGVMALLTARGGPWRRHRPDPDRMLARFTRQYDLTAEQQGAAKAVLEDASKELDALRRDTRAKLADVRSRTRGRLRAILTPEQQKKFDENMARQDARRKRSEP